jgi:hypothetical protein
MRDTDLTQDQKRDAIARAAEAGDICIECFRWLPDDTPVSVIPKWGGSGASPALPFAKGSRSRSVSTAR